MNLLTRIASWFTNNEVLPEFTPRAQQALAISRKIAVHRQKVITENDDLLVAFCVLGSGSAYEALKQCGSNPADILTHFGISDGWQKQVAPAHFPYHDAVKIVLALAIRESKSMKSAYVGTDHILIAMFNPRTGSMSAYFKAQGIILNEIKSKLNEMKNKKKEPNQALEPTTTAVTSPAAQEPRQL